ncbi:MAG: hypothetical protein ACOYUK_03655 [Patescibacteria group bacterium]
MFDVNTSWLKINYFVLTHKQDLRKWYIIVLIAVAIFAVVFTVTNVILYVVSTPVQHRLMAAMAADQVDYVGIRQRTTPTGLQLGSTNVIPSGVGRYDIVMPVTNVNDDWYAEVSYTVTINGTASDPLTHTINPGSTGFLTGLGIAGPTSGQIAAQLSVESIAWERIDYHQRQPEVNFDIQNVAYSALNANDVIVHQVKADITNDSFTSYYQVPFIVLLYNGDQIVGVNYAYVQPFTYSDTETITVKWNAVGGTVTSVAIHPDLNLRDSSNIIR